MITQIEENSIQFLMARLEGIKKSGSRRAGERLSLSAIDASCLEGVFEKVASSWKQTVTLSMLITFSSQQGEEPRRKAINALVQACVGLLAGRKLDLPIAALAPLRWREVTDKEDFDEGKIRFLLQFSTSFSIDPIDDEEVEDLLGIAMEYFFLPGDEVADAADEFTNQGDSI